MKHLKQYLLSLLILGTGLVTNAQILVVDDTGDAGDAFPGDGICATSFTPVCTLRAAIEEANAFPGANTIDFSLASGSIITIDSELLLSDDFTTIDADLLGDGKPDIIIISGNAGINGFNITSANNVLQGFNLIQFSGIGRAINIDGIGATGNRIISNYIGTNLAGDDATGTGNFRSLRIINGASGNFIGDATIVGRNIISGNTFSIEINGSDNNTITGNIIGLDATGTFDFGNGSIGIEVISSTGTIIGAAGEGINFISGNNAAGIEVNNSPNTTIANNYIGTNSAGNSDLGNSNEGVYILGTSPGTFIGTGIAGEGNVISGNTNQGILISSSGVNILGNIIGLNAAGTAAIPNSNIGVDIAPGATSVVIGNETTDGRNTISGNSSHGLRLRDGPNTVKGNYIGVRSNGNQIVANGGIGVFITAGASSEIGGVNAGEGNVISGNTAGIQVAAGAHFIYGNTIGLNETRTIIRANNEGIRLTGTAQNVLIGDGTAAGANFISGNTTDGILIDGTNVNGNIIQNNYIGVEGDLTTPAGNGANGIIISGDANSNTINNNVISNSGDNGIEANGAFAPGTLNNKFTQNSIYNNTGKGISIVAGAQNGILAPTINSVLADGTIAGTSDPSANIEIFFDAADEGGSYSLPALADASGNWTTNIPLNSFPSALFNITTTQTVVANTSEFSTPFDITPTFDPYIVVNTNDSGAGSLRWCIENANALAGADIITFAIPASDLNYVNTAGDERWTISPVSDLPTSTESITIDGTSQPGGGNFRIKIDGQDIRTNGFKVSSGPSSFYGLYITNFTRGIYDIFGGEIIVGDVNKGNVINSCNQGISTGTASNHVIKGNFIGTDETGMFAMGNATGIGMTTAGGVIIGGSLPGEGNVISGNANTGISHNSGSNNHFEGNYIGTNATGTAAIPNGTGIGFGTGGGHTVINNVISGNANYAISMNNAGNITFQGNKIGVGLNGVDPIPNNLGIATITFLAGGNNIIGGTGAGEGNIIAQNINQGIYFRYANNINNQVIGNSIYCNGGKGIDLEGTGNGNKSAPIITGFTTTSASGTGEIGDIIHVYRDNSGCTPLQGGEHLGTTVVDGTGNWNLGILTLNLTDLINATATDASFNTSEFAFNFGEIDLYQGVDNTGIAVTDGQITDVDIGTAFEGYDLDQTFAIENTTGAPLNISSITVSGTDFEILQAPTNVAPWATENFILRLSGGVIGSFNTTLTIISDDEDEGIFNFPVIGQIIVNAIPDPLLVTNVDKELIPGSLRTVIDFANTNPGSDTIRFDLGIINQEILIDQRLDITGDSTVIDGDILGDCLPHITINGIDGGDGFWITGSHSVIKHLNIIKYPGGGIWIKSDSNRVQGNYIGINLAGDDVTENGNTYGVWVHIGKHNIVGGTTACERNIISGNWWGVVMGGNTSNTDSTYVIGNYLGTDYTGTVAMGIGTTSGTTTGAIVTRTGGTHFIGGTNPNEGNIISGNDWGINVSRVTDTVRIIGNYIGLDATGTVGLGNRAYGIYSDTYAKIGDGTIAGRNVISGHTNPAYGIYLTIWNTNPASNTVLGNYIGTDVSGTASIPNYVGVGAYSGTATHMNYIGDGTIGGRNLIAFNDYGIDIGGTAVVLGNYVGTDPSGTIAQGNTIGVSAYSSGATTFIGNGTGSGANLISGNGTGIDIGWAAADNITVDRNYIGVQPDGIISLPNTGDGLYLHNPQSLHTIKNNVIANNGANGVNMDGAGVINNSLTTNSIYNNTLKGISIVNGAQNGVAPPAITSISSTTIGGTSDPSALLNVFADIDNEGEYFIGSTISDASGDWSLAYTLASIPVERDYVTATQTNANNTSEFSIPQPFYQGGVIACDYNALVALYNATDGANWTNNTNWLSANPVSTWFGITVVGNRVNNILIEFNNLNGSLPKELSCLTALYELDLEGNNLTGSIPSELGLMAGLYELDLDDNQLIGSIPVELGNIAGLSDITLQNNLLTGTIPIELGSLTGIWSLRLTNNQLSGPIPTELGNLVNLNYLRLGNNQLSGSIPTSFSNLTNLFVLHLDNNQLSGSIPVELGSLTNLTDLRLHINQLSGSMPSELGNLTNLTDLELNDNQLSGSIPVELGNLINLTWLDCGNNLLTGSIPIELGNLLNLTKLDFGANQLSGSLPLELGDLSSILYLTFDTNQLTGSIPIELGNLTGLLELWLEDNLLSGNIPAQLGNLTSLDQLSLRTNQLSGAVPAAFTNLTNLTGLWIHENQLEDLPDLSSLSMLSSFGTENNNFQYDDIEPNVGITGILYSPQNLIPGPGPQTIIEGNPLNLAITVGGSANQYQWVKDGTDLVGQTSNVLNLTVSAPADVGTYYLRITSTLVPGLTLRTDDIVVTVITPEINVFEGADNTGTAIIDAQATAIDFGSAVQPNDITQTFALENTGTNILNITSITISGSDYSVASTITAIAIGATETFTVTLSGTNLGTFNTTVTIVSDDADENPFTFDITGLITVTTEPEINVYAGADNTGTAIIDAQVTAIDFGSAVQPNDITQTFALENTGTNILNITSITILGSDYSVASTITAIAIGATETFTLTLSGTNSGTFNTTIAIVNDDADENPFTFDITGIITAVLLPKINIFEGFDNTGNQVTLNQSSFVNLGSTSRGTDIDKTFSIDNSEIIAVNISSIATTNSKYEVINAPTIVQPGTNEQFIIRLIADDIGQFDTDVLIVSDFGNFAFSITGEVLEAPVSPIVVYNAVSPNGDGKHDYLEMANVEFYPNNHVQIMNRWGDIIYEISGYNNDNNKFDGRANKGGAGELPSGTYFYQIDLGDNSPIINGFFDLRR